VKKQLTQTLLLCAAPLSIFGSQAALSQTQEGYIEKVFVTGTRKAYQGDFDDLDTPQADLKITNEVLINAGAINLDQALDLSASVARQNNFGGLWNSFAVRGFVGDENLPSNFLVNGFNAGRGFGGPRDLSGIESVEILKGPRAALFGRGEPGGTINLVTKKPTFEREGEVTISAGSFDTYRTDADWTAPLSDNVAIRLVGFYEDAESFRDTIETKKQGLSPSIAWRISDDSQLTYEIEYSAQEIPFDRGVVAINGELGALPIERFLGEPGDGPMQADVLGHQIEWQHSFNDNWSTLVGANLRNTSLEGFATENGFAGGRQFLQRDGENLSRFRRFRDYDATYKVIRAELNGEFETGSVSHRLIVGVDADKFENDQVFLRARGTSINDDEPIEDELTRLRETNQVINVFNPVYGAYPLPEPGANTDRLEVQESRGFYIQDQITLSESLELRVGARFDDYEQSLKNRRSDTTSRYAQSQVSPQLGLVYKASETFSFYAVYGENFRPLSGATDENSLEPNESTSTEAGVKFSLDDGALSGTIAVFDIEQSNIATVDENFNATAVGAASSQGIEVDLTGQLTRTMNIWLSYTHISAETGNAFVEPNFGVELPAGSDLLNVPANQFSLMLNKEAKVNGKDLNLIAGLIYVGERNGFFSDQSFKLPSYSTTRIAANYSLTENVDLHAEVNNLFDKEYYTNSFADVWVLPGAPRNVRFSATFKF